MAQAEQAQVDLVKITNRLISNELKINYQNQTYSALEVKVTDTNGTTQSMFQLPTEVYVHVICFSSVVFPLYFDIKSAILGNHIIFLYLFL